ncbi:MAG: hypothetical protein HKN37_16540 [Rhodothermales bacterium]|nr:hypothetical protein [Rhodothermales bacterium]
MTLVRARVQRGRVLVPVFSIILLASCNVSPSFTLEFPVDADLGELWLIEDVNCFTCGNGEEYLGRASGTYEVRLPAQHWYVSLRMPRGASHLMEHLAHPSLSTIGDIDLWGSDIRDEDLRYVAGINLRSINLGGTAITGAGVEHMAPHQKWTWINLQGCDNLDPQFLAHFRGWKRATIRLVSQRSSNEPYSEAELALLKKARETICDGAPEEICGTQIR